MPRIEPDIRKHPEERPMEWHRRMRGAFIVEYLQFSLNSSANQSEVRNAYQDMIGEPRKKFNAQAIGKLNRSIKRMGATLDKDERTFYGVRLRNLNLYI